ncbi:MAG: ATPase, T2SS/T4P/T4SS family [Planctomycetota bacterium]|nr:ATPase, T2SS/T4P/T4SS family [Planctomycetota bacterium]MDA1105037.1 ATPase, T2SS/T4P/T4SS family [Planctomycetota bacterium]
MRARSIDELKGRRIGRVLNKLGLLTKEQAEQAMHEQIESRRDPKSDRSGTTIGSICVAKGWVTERQVEQAIAGSKGFDYLPSLEGVEVPPECAERVTAQSARSFKIIPLAWDNSTRQLRVAVAGVEGALDTTSIAQLLSCRVEAIVAPAAEIDAALKRLYGGASGAPTVAAERDLSEAVKAAAGRGESLDIETLAKAADANEIVQLVNLMVLTAVQERASDIHLEPFETGFRVRQRIDGVLYEMKGIDPSLASACVSRVKVMAKLNIAERRLPQDGRIALKFGGKPIDMRVSVLPTIFGESVVLRVLDRSNVQLDLHNIGLRDDELAKVERIIRKPNGIVVVTGPTGSGKTTTLYAALSALNDIETKLLTAEDPVEYDIDGLIQCQVNLDQELTFAKLLRSFLRQDPDVILIGEIRDLETAQIAIQASLTGHLVLTTLHTNDAPSSILRLLDLGVENFLLTATLEAIVAQRLVRRICVHCKEEFSPTEAESMELGLRLADLGGRTLHRGKGCDKCSGGYRGRRALFEIMAMDDDLRELVMQNASTSVLAAECRKRGMRTLRESGLLALYEGQTTIEEVVRETLGDE